MIWPLLIRNPLVFLISHRTCTFQKKPSPVTGCVVAFVESETDTGTSSDGMRRGGQNPRTVTPQQHQFQQYTDDLASDENNNGSVFIILELSLRLCFLYTFQP